MFVNKLTKSLIALSLSATIMTSSACLPINPVSYAATHLSVSQSWSTYKAAIVQMKKKNYSVAYSKLKAAESGIIRSKNKNNTALLYKNLGNCAAHTGKYKEADAYWMKEAEWWKKAGYIQDAIYAERKAYLIRQDIRLFTVGKADSVSALTKSHVYHGAKYEPLVGTFIGAYAVGDKFVENKKEGKSHITEFPKLAGKDHAGYLYYFTYGGKLDGYVEHAKKLKETGGVMQLAIEPMKGLSQVEDDEYLNYLAETIGSMDIPVFVRFANEMNDPTSKWYEKDPQVYIKKYRMFANKIREKAPNAVMVWAPLYFPPHNMTWYYPGDDVVDWVGISIYRQYHPELDPLWNKSQPLSQAVDRFKFADHFKTIYDLYADKKPIFVSECGVSYQHDVNGNNITPFAINELSDYYTYVPMLYPKMKALFYFDVNVKNKFTRYQLSTNDDLLKTYQNGIKNPYYLSRYNDQSNIQYQELPSYSMPAEKKSLFTYVKSYDPTVASVSYIIGDEKTAASTGIKPMKINAYAEPYEISVDFSQYASRKLPIKIIAFNKKGVVVAEESFKINVRAISK